MRRPEGGDRVDGSHHRRRHVRQYVAVGLQELERAIRRRPDAVPVLVNRAVMTTAEQDEVSEGGGATLGPMLDVMALAQA